MSKQRTTTPREDSAKPRWSCASSLVALARMLALLALATSALVYPLKLDEGLMTRLQGLAHGLPGGALLLESMRPYLEFSFSPLTIKEVVTSWVLLALVGAWITWKMSTHPSRHRSHPGLLFLLLFLVWSVGSVTLAPQFGIDSGPIYTAFDLALWVVFAIALTDLPGSKRFSRVAVGAILFIGLILMLVSTAEAIDRVSSYVFRVLPRIDSPYKRNIFGGLIGHNTGVASICMGPFFFALGLFFATKRKILRMLLLLYIALSLYFFLVTQSRSVWVFLVLLTPIFLLGLRPVIGAPIRLRHFLVGLLLMVLFVGSQLVPARWNFLHIQEAEFVNRLKAFTPKVLLTETRLRILAVSLPLIAEKPILGHGLGSFVSVYPRAQAEYFDEHPDSVLYPTFHLTDVAHDDYLQLVIETGFLGFGLAVAAAWFFFRRGLVRFRRLKSPWERLVRYCALFAALEILLHAFVDFPFHVVPLATFLLFYCAMAYGAPEEDDDTHATEPRMAEQQHASATTFRPAKVAVLVAILLCWGGLIAGGAFAGRRLLADMFFSRAMNPPGYGARGEDTKSVEDRLIATRELLRQSLNIDPLSYDACFFRGYYDYGLAQIYADEARKSAQRGMTANAQAAQKNAVRVITSSIGYLYRAGHIAAGKGGDEGDDLGPRVSHTLFYSLAQSWNLAGQLIPASRDEAIRNSFTYYQLAARYSPSYSVAIMDLLDFMGQNHLGTVEQRRHYMGLIARYDRAVFLGKFLGRVGMLTNQERYDAAEGLLVDLAASVRDRDDYPEISEVLAQVYVMLQEPAKHHAVLEDMRRRFPEYPFLADVEIDDLAMARQYEAAEKLAAGLIAKRKEPGEPLLFTESELLTRLGRHAEGEQLARKTLRNSAKPSAAYAARAQVRLHLFGDKAGATDDFAKAVNFFPAAVPENAYLFLIRAQADQGDWQGANKAVTLAKKRIPTNPALDTLIAELRQQPGGSVIGQ